MSNNMKKLTASCILITMLFLSACSNRIIIENTESPPSELEPPATAEVFNVPPTPIYVNGKEITEVGCSSREGIINYSLDMLLTDLQYEYPDSIWDTGIAVIGEFVEEADEKFNYEYNDYFEKEVVTRAVSYNQFLISEVLMNNGSVKEGDIITIGQNYAFDEEQGAYMSFTNMTPMHKGDRWIYFLTRSKESGVFFNVPDGRYPLPGKGIGQIMEDVIKLSRQSDDFLSDKKTDMMCSEFIEKYGERASWLDKESGYYYMTGPRVMRRINAPNGIIPERNLNEEAVYRLTEDERSKWNDMGYHTFVELPSNIETSALGVLNRSEIYSYFSIYADILEYFNIESSDWVNPGRGFDARLVELYETQKEEYEVMNEEHAGHMEDADIPVATRME